MSAGAVLRWYSARGDDLDGAVNGDRDYPIGTVDPLVAVELRLLPDRENRADPSAGLAWMRGSGGMGFPWAQPGRRRPRGCSWSEIDEQGIDRHHDDPRSEQDADTGQ